MAKNEKAAQNFIGEMNKIAEELFNVRKALQPREEQFEEMKRKFEEDTQELYAKESELKSKLIEDLNMIGLRSIKVKSGDSISMVKTRKLDIIEPKALMDWAIKKQLASLDRIKIKAELESMVKAGQKMPEFVSLKEVDTIKLNMPTIKAKK